MAASTAPRSELWNSALQAARALERWGSARSWCGTDPYDALNTRRLTSVLSRSALSRRMLTQAVKRSPIDLRPPLGIVPGRSAAALAWVASAYCKDRAAIADDPERSLQETLERLWDMRCRDYAEPCWGYHFDVQTRAFFYPRSVPNTIATAFAGHAFLDAYERTNRDRWLHIARGVADFFISHVPATETPEGIFFGYLVGDRTPIHNANMLVCSLLSRVARTGGTPTLGEYAAAGVSYTLAHQRPDGSWPYGEQPGLGWIDNFHTGYVLEALMRCQRTAARDRRLDAAIDRGLDFYRQALFRPDGAPKYYSSKVYPIDTQCVAQAIQTFALAAPRDAACAAQAWRIAAFGLSRMRRGDGAFIFQRRALWKNSTPHVRWCQAPMLLALANLLLLPR